MSAETNVVAVASRPKGKVRMWIVAVLLLVILVAYLDRVNVSILIADPQFLEDMGLKGQAAKQGLLMTFFLIPYAISNIALGYLGDRLGPRIAMSISVFLWSVALFIGGAARNFTAMLGARTILGFGEGLHYPMQSSFVKNWFPAHERARANAIWGIGLLMGPAIAMPIVAMIISNWGWRASFYSLAVLGLLVPLPLIWFFTSDRPRQFRFISEEERDYLESSLAAESASFQTGERKSVGTLKSMLTTSNFWLITIGWLCLTAIWYGILLWLPQYLKVARGFSWTQMGFLSSLPYVAGVVSTLLVSAVSDKVRRRAPFFSVGMLLAATCLYLGASTSSDIGSVLFISCGIFFLALGLPTAWAILQGILPPHLIGTGSGIMNGVANLGGALSPVFVGYLIGITGNYAAGFVFFVGLGVVGFLSILVLALRKL
jgi:sugar phosphate permease